MLCCECLDKLGFKFQYTMLPQTNSGLCVAQLSWDCFFKPESSVWPAGLRAELASPPVIRVGVLESKAPWRTRAVPCCVAVWLLPLLFLAA